MPAIIENKNVFSFLRKHPVISIFALLSVFVFLLVLIAVYSSPPQTIRVDTRRKPQGFAPEPAFAPAAIAPAAMATILPGMSKRAERIMGAVFVVIGVALSVLVLQVVR
ncbi:MAG: hypothetical protein M1539_06725 [Actinobacteria bacterium]|nr:hypothetical protein [Actinomycetota bacterium]MCL5883648.1 hypothetical protein [Actinomycetota bacterium]